MNERAQIHLKQSSPASFTPVSGGVLQRKCACGNRTVAGGECSECAKKKSGLQRKLAIGASNDPLEQEADRVAEQVMAAPTHSAVSGAPLHIQRYAGQATEGVESAPASVDRVLAGSGIPLNLALRQDMEQRFGHDFSRVRVHSGGAAEQSAQNVNANAYTVGHNVVFGAGRFAPETHEGRRLIAHELTHVVQQIGNTGALRRQLATRSTQASKPDLAPGLGPTRTKEVENLMKSGDFQGAIDTLVGYKYMDYEIELNLLADKKMTYDPNLKSSDGSTSMPSWDYLSTPQKADPARVRIGPSAFSSVPYLYSVIMHEYQHVLWQQTLPNQNLSKLVHSQGFQSPDEVEAGAWELLHATETGVARLPDKIAQIWENLNEAFWKLDAQEQVNERQLVVRAFQKAKTFMKGSQLTLVPFSHP